MVIERPRQPCITRHYFLQLKHIEFEQNLFLAKILYLLFVSTNQGLPVDGVRGVVGEELPLATRHQPHLGDSWVPEQLVVSLGQQLAAVIGHRLPPSQSPG